MWYASENLTGQSRYLQDRPLNVLARLIPHASPFAEVLTATHDVPNQAIPAEETAVCCLRGRRLGREPLLRAAEAGLNKGPASADPMAVAAVNELVSAARKAALRRVLTRRQPRDQPWQVHVSVYKSVSRIDDSYVTNTPAHHNIPRDTSMWGIDNRKATEGTKGICTVGLIARLG